MRERVESTFLLDSYVQMLESWASHQFHSFGLVFLLHYLPVHMVKSVIRAKASVHWIIPSFKQLYPSTYKHVLSKYPSLIFFSLFHYTMFQKAPNFSQGFLSHVYFDLLDGIKALSLYVYFWQLVHQFPSILICTPFFPIPFVLLPIYAPVYAQSFH